MSPDMYPNHHRRYSATTHSSSQSYTTLIRSASTVADISMSHSRPYRLSDLDTRLASFEYHNRIPAGSMSTILKSAIRSNAPASASMVDWLPVRRRSRRVQPHSHPSDPNTVSCVSVHRHRMSPSMHRMRRSAPSCSSEVDYMSVSIRVAHPDIHRYVRYSMSNPNISHLVSVYRYHTSVHSYML